MKAKRRFDQVFPKEDLALLTIAEVQDFTGFSRTYIWEKVKDGTFPKPVDAGTNRIYFYTGEIRQWLAARPRKGEQACA